MNMEEAGLFAQVRQEARDAKSENVRLQQELKTHCKCLLDEKLRIVSWCEFHSSLDRELAEAEATRHDENCDCRDTMIRGKPCNCYLLYKADLAEAQIKLRAADAMAKIVDDSVVRKLIDSRSALADARLSYGAPYKYDAKENTELAVAKKWLVDREGELRDAQETLTKVYAELAVARAEIEALKSLRHEYLDGLKVGLK